MEKSHHFPLLESPDKMRTDRLWIFRAAESVPEHIWMEIAASKTQDVGEQYDTVMKIKELAKKQTIDFEPELAQSLASRIIENGFYENGNIWWGTTSTDPEAITEMDDVRAKAYGIVTDLADAILNPETEN